MKVKGLFINNAKAQDSIYESGNMVYNCLRLSEQFQLDYVEISQHHPNIPTGYDFYLFNYHPGTMSWVDTSKLRKLPGLVLSIVLEVLPGDPFVLCPDKHFHGYMVLDPTINIPNRRVFSFLRPLDPVPALPAYQEKAVPVIGSFGFATKGKGFQHVIEAVNKEFDKAIVRINIPFGDFVPDSEAYSKFLAKTCQERAKAGVEVIVTHDYMSKEALIRWCAENTLNCFLYDRNMPGLAATTDQAIVAGRPLAVSQNETFRHILAYLPPYPQWDLQRSIRESGVIVAQMQRDWAQDSFTRKFESMLLQLMPEHPRSTIVVGQFSVPVLQHNFSNKLTARYRKYKRLLTFRRIRQWLMTNQTKHEELI